MTYKMLDTSGLKLQDPGFSELDVSSLGDKTKMANKNMGKMQAVSEGANQLVSAAGMEDTETGGAVGGAASGATTGMALGGPWGAAIGGVVGGIAGGLSARSKRKAENRRIEATKISNIGNIRQQQGIQQANILQGLANNLANTLV